MSSKQKEPVKYINIPDQQQWQEMDEQEREGYLNPEWVKWNTAPYPSTAAPEPEIDLIGNDPLDWAFHELMGLSDKFGRQIYTVSRLFAAIRTKRDRGNGVCVCNRADQPKPERAEGESDADWEAKEIRRRIDENKAIRQQLIASAIERAFVVGYFNQPNPPASFVDDIADGHLSEAWERCKPTLLSPSPSSTPTASGTEGVRLQHTTCGNNPQFKELRDNYKRGITPAVEVWFYVNKSITAKEYYSIVEQTVDGTGPAPSFDESNLRACLAAEKKLVAYWKGKAEGLEGEKQRPLTGDFLQDGNPLRNSTIGRTKQDIIDSYSDQRFCVGMPFNYELLYKAMQDYSNQELASANAQIASLNERLEIAITNAQKVAQYSIEQDTEIASLKAERDSYRVLLKRLEDSFAVIGMVDSAYEIEKLLAQYPQTKTHE